MNEHIEVDLETLTIEMITQPKEGETLVDAQLMFIINNLSREDERMIAATLELITRNRELNQQVTAAIKDGGAQ